MDPTTLVSYFIMYLRERGGGEGESEIIMKLSHTVHLHVHAHTHTQSVTVTVQCYSPRLQYKHHHQPYTRGATIKDANKGWTHSSSSIIRPSPPCSGFNKSTISTSFSLLRPKEREGRERERERDYVFLSSEYSQFVMGYINR